VFWVGRPAYIVVCLAAAVAVWFSGWGRGRERMLLWMDALGAGAYAIVGALKATSLGLPPLTAVVMGVLTGTFGGVLRDILAHEPSILLKRELYVTPALVGSSLFVTLIELGVGALVASVVGILAAFLLRAGGIVFGWALPGFPGRGPPN
jgi:uncharacterized membrane protein YeiH